MPHLIPIGERFRDLEVTGHLPTPEDENPRYRVRCLRCKSDCVTATENALLMGRVTMCWDCRYLASLSAAQRSRMAARQKFDLTYVPPVLDHLGGKGAGVEKSPTASLTLGEALAYAA